MTRRPFPSPPSVAGCSAAPAAIQGGGAGDGAPAARNIPPDLAQAIDDMVIAGRLLSPLPGDFHPPATASAEDGQRHYGGRTPAYYRWLAWSRARKLRLAWDAYVTAEIATAIDAELASEPQQRRSRDTGNRT